MSQTAILQREPGTELYHLLEQEVRKEPRGTCSLLFLYCAGESPGLEDMVKGFFNPMSGVHGEVRKDPVTKTLAVILPGLTLDAAHYQALLLKQLLLEMNENSDPRITLSAGPHASSPQAIRKMAESARLSTTQDIQIFSEDEAGADTSRILIVDHDTTIREFLQIRLAMQGYETLEAVDGLEALELIPKWEPDLVLTELNLYGIDGLPFIHHIQQLDVNPKIVVLTEKRVEQTISQCFQNGVDDYVTKPFSPVELDARIRRCLH
ncbi:response regulator transcription factor [Paenibacillus dakarensis]|uniref:response regulator transcription factor n=1 Tax=Paenibacillus dakarensis TaxID=1527293 RepID=UPI0006D57FDB|nr:response regulator [Paenibacillus dakarensis]